MSEWVLSTRQKRLRLSLAVLGVLLLVLSVATGISQRRQFAFSYLFAWVFWVGLSLGCLSVTMIHQLTGGRWGFPTRRFLEAGGMTLPLMLILLLPVFFFQRELYAWARPAEVASDPLLHRRAAYLNPGQFIIRNVIFFVVVTAAAWWLRKYSIAQDKTAAALPTIRARRLSGPGVVLYSLSTTFIYVDWVMSLETDWHSTMFSVIMLIGNVLLAFAFCIVLVFLFRNSSPLLPVLTRTHYHHLGNLLLTFVLFWTYISYGQLLVIYSGDLPHEIHWYLHRIAGSWKYLVGALAALHFFVPFFLLLFRPIKQHAACLAALAGLVFVMHILNTYWLVMPALHTGGIRFHWLDLVLPLGIGAVWVVCFLSLLGTAPPLPQQDPGLHGSALYRPTSG